MTMVLQLFETYKNLLLQTSLSVSLALLLTFLKLPVFFLRGLHTYIHPENVGQQNGVKAAIRRPNSSDSAPVSNADLRRRHKPKDKFEFDESNAQIFRLKLDEAHLQTRLYFNDYWYSFLYSSLALSCFLLYKYLGVEAASDGAGAGILASSGSVVLPFVFGLASFCKLLVSLARVSFEKSASKRSEKQLALLVGLWGFGFGLMICSGIGHSVFSFDLASVDGFGKFFVALLMGCFAGFLYMPAGKNARSFWLGTDQLRSNLSMIYCGWFGRMILYASYLFSSFTVLLWISPLTEILLFKGIDNNNRGTHSTISGNRDADKLAGNLGFTRTDFDKLRFWCLFLSGILQILALRPNLQMFLNEALLSWYQRLHASKVPDLDFSRAKVFLHNHYMCLVVLQFLAPPVLVLLFLGFSQIDGDSFRNIFCGLIPCSAFTREIPAPFDMFNLVGN
ncbi:hypothetical protein Tsubulata_042818 [Turnera subulata]|uniref:Uncharacterized protein n=1 Tax=Turnera subulata TaxID=218843 RepID=A0A9Q0FD58_9ROSI|nr:hypothetical protein Tsubulata_042818 [Turnera subulata]